MGIIYDLLSQMDEYDIATEADDITGEARQGAAKTMGGQSVDPAGDQNNGDISLNTDDIFADNNENQNEDTPQEKKEPDQNDDGTQSEENNPDDMNSMANNEQNAPETPEDDQPENIIQEDSSESVRKRKLQKQLLHFYEVLSGDIKLVSEYVPKVTDSETIQALGSINKNLTQCRSYIYQLITEDLTTQSYAVLMKKYVAINQVYGLTIRSLDQYFQNKHEDGN